jgi:hypothetical protein
MITSGKIVLCAAALLASTLVSAESMRLKLTRSESLGAAGLKVRPFHGFVNSPVPVARAMGYRSRSTGDHIEAYDPRELWLQDQHLATFKSRYGTVTLGELQYDVLTGFPLLGGKHVRLDDFEKARDSSTTDWQRDSIERWVEYFVGRKIDTIRDSVESYNLDVPYLAYTFESSTENRLGFLLTMPGRRIFVLFDLDPNTRFTNLHRTANRFLLSITPIHRDVQNQPRKRFQNNRVIRGSDRQSDAYAAARKRVVDNIKNIDGWWYAETPNYVLTSDLTTRNRRLATEIQRDVELMRSAYTKLIPPLKPVEEVSVIRVFRERSDYLNYVGGKLKWSGGLWMPNKKELVISPIEIINKKNKRDLMLKVVYHEGFHQYLFYALDRLQTPIWFNEGHATFFESCRVYQNRDTIQIIENDRRRRDLEILLKRRKPPDLRKVILMDYGEFIVNNKTDAQSDKLRRQHYALSWALVYFLRKGAHLYESNYDEVCPAVIAKLQATRGNRIAASQAAVDMLDMDQLNKDFYRFWTTRGNRQKAERTKLF